MVIGHTTVTMNGNAQALSSVLTLDPLDVRRIELQPGAANVNPVFLGGATVSSTDYGVRLEVPVTGIPPAPWIVAEERSVPVTLQQLYIRGTSGEKLHILFITQRSHS